MRRFTVSLSLALLVLLSSAVVIARPPAAAQEATPAGMAATASHPAVGAWTFVSGSGEDVVPSIAHFHADGTYTEVLPWGPVLMGAWAPTGERTVVVTLVLNEVHDDKLWQGQGRATAELDETGNTMTWESIFVGRYQDGTIEFADEGTPSTGTRLQAGPMISLEDLIATPVPVGAAAPAAGTPVP
jgi:hypothetical protein